MEYFKNFPTITYDDTMSITNIMVRARVREKILSNELSYYNYRVSDGDKPEIIADKYYGHSRYAWLVLYANNIVDPQFDWPLSYKEFISYLHGKYKNDTEQDYEVIARLQSTVHHYENAKGQTVLQTEGSPVTYYDWEQTLNENKRDIKVIDSKYLTEILEEFKNIFR